jgi:hypothetical protein
MVQSPTSHTCTPIIFISLFSIYPYLLQSSSTSMFIFITTLTAHEYFFSYVQTCYNISIYYIILYSIILIIILSTIYSTSTLPLMYSFHVLGFIITWHIHLSILISTTFIFWSIFLYTALSFKPYKIIDLTSI